MKILIKTFLLAFIIFANTWVLADTVVRYSEYKNDWTLTDQYFEIWNKSDTSTGYNVRSFQVSTWTLASDWCTPTSSWWDANNFTEYWSNFTWLWKIEINNNLWKFKPWKAFESLPLNSEVIFCYNDWNISSDTITKIRIIKTEPALTIKTIWSSNEKRVFLSKTIWTYWSNVEIFFRCEQEDLFSEFDTWEMEEKIYLNLKRFNLKTYNDDYSTKIETKTDKDPVDTQDTRIIVNWEIANMNFYFNKESSDQVDSPPSSDLELSKYQSTVKFINANPWKLEMSLYSTRIDNIDNLSNYWEFLYAKWEWLSLSTSVDIAWLEWYYFTLVTHIKWSTAKPSLKVYYLSSWEPISIVRYDAIPWITAPWTQIEFETVVTTYKDEWKVAYVEVLFDDDRFDSLRLYSQSSGSTAETANTNMEQTFRWRYQIPSDNSLNWLTVNYDIYVIQENWTRTKSATWNWENQIYIWSRENICIHPSICAIRWLKALDADIKTDFHKKVMGIFTDYPETFSLDDIYKKFRKLRSGF